MTPYAASKVAAEYAGLQAFLGHGLEVVRVRPFNHVGPGQAGSFVVAALAARVVEAERAGADEIRVGDLTPARDFTDVRDVVRAYRLLAEAGVPGDVYNVCSGVAVPIATVLAEIVALAPPAGHPGRGPGALAAGRPAGPRRRRRPPGCSHRLEAGDPAARHARRRARGGPRARRSGGHPPRRAAGCRPG